MIALIMAGGSGTRFWPLSSETLPKQFLRLFGEKSMLRLTFERVADFVKTADIYVVTTIGQRDLILEHIPELNPSQIIIEPYGMNTAPCIGLSIAYLSKIYPSQETVFVLPADHFIPDIDKFAKAIKSAEPVTRDDKLLTFGILPTYPAVGYGYIEAGDAYTSGTHHVLRFKEKPDLDTATEMLEKGNFFWNSGMLCFSIETINRSFEKFCPEVLTLAHKCISTDDMGERDQIYRYMPRLPIDIAILEKAHNVIVMPVSFVWSDVGNWFSLSELMTKDENRNYSQGRLYADTAWDNAVFSKKQTAIIGASDLVVVETEDSILIVHKDFVERVKLVTDIYRK